jgi:hypothetical protein
MHRNADEEENESEKPENVPSFLTARELQARKPRPGDQANPAANPRAGADKDDESDDENEVEKPPRKGGGGKSGAGARS